MSLTVHAALGLPSASANRAGPPPTETLRALQDAPQRGIFIENLVDNVADNRAEGMATPRSMDGKDLMLLACM